MTKGWRFTLLSSVAYCRWVKIRSSRTTEAKFSALYHKTQIKGVYVIPPLIRGRCNVSHEQKQLPVPGNAHSFIKERGSITVPSTSWKPSLDMDVVDINKNFLYNLVRQAFWEVTVCDPSLFFYKRVSVPCPPYKRNGTRWKKFNF